MTDPSGAPTAPGGRTLVVACGALARELLQVVQANGLDHVDVECLPASYHNTPDVIPDAVAERVRAAAGRHDRVFVGYGDCGTGGRLDTSEEQTSELQSHLNIVSRPPGEKKK